MTFSGTDCLPGAVLSGLDFPRKRVRVRYYALKVHRRIRAAESGATLTSILTDVYGNSTTSSTGRRLPLPKRRGTRGRQGRRALVESPLVSMKILNKRPPHALDPKLRPLWSARSLDADRRPAHRPAPGP